MMAGRSVSRFWMVGRKPAHLRHHQGRHRLGTPGLNHCRQLDDIQARLTNATDRHRHIAAASPAHISAEVATLVTIVIVAGAVLVSGSYAAAAAVGIVAAP